MKSCFIGRLLVIATLLFLELEHWIDEIEAEREAKRRAHNPFTVDDFEGIQNDHQTGMPL